MNKHVDPGDLARRRSAKPRPYFETHIEGITYRLTFDRSWELRYLARSKGGQWQEVSRSRLPLKLQEAADDLAVGPRPTFSSGVEFNSMLNSWLD